MATSSHPRRLLPLLVVLALVMLFFDLGRMEVWSDNEGQRATPPAEMLRYGQWIIPTLNGADYLAKPPLLYWTIAAVYKLTGCISPFTARIPGAICAVVLVVGVYLFLRREAGENPARWAALALLASPYFLERARSADLDVPLMLAVFLAIVSLRAADAAPSSSRRIGLMACGGVAFGAAILLKGPVPFLFLWAAWIARAVETAAEPNRVLGLGLRWSVVAFGIAVLAFVASVVLTPLWPSADKTFGFPIPLLMVMAVWTVLALQQNGPALRRQLSVWLPGMLLGIALAAPWAIAVLAVKGWPFVGQLLQGEVIERTRIATPINSGSPFYFLIALPALLAPWSFLFPLHISRHQWFNRPPVYRFSLVMGWLSVLTFSLLAGKEYEYILPGVPFLLIVTGFLLGEAGQRRQEDWLDDYLGFWLWLMPWLLGGIAVGLAVYGGVSIPHPIALVEVSVFCLCALGLAGFARRQTGQRRLAAVLGIALLLLLSWLVTAADRANSGHSMKALAQLSGDLARAGLPVEGSKIYPAFAFYAGTKIPIEQDPEAVCRKLDGPEPYYYVTRKEWLPLLPAPWGSKPSYILAGPYTRKGLVLLGNRSLPPGATNKVKSSSPTAQGGP